MDKIFKFLRKRNKKERLLLMAMVDLIVRNELKNLDIKKIKGRKDIFRVRAGDFRIIFKKTKPENIIQKIDERDDRTYKL